MLFFIGTTADCDVYFSLSPNNFAEKNGEEEMERREEEEEDHSANSIQERCPPLSFGHHLGRAGHVRTHVRV